MKVFAWGSEENESFPAEGTYGHIQLDGDNAAYVVLGEGRDDRTQFVLFFGPEAERNSLKWAEWGRDEANEDKLMDTGDANPLSELIKEVLG